MKVLLIRHGIAVDRIEAVTDADRELTKIGRKRMKQIARGLHCLIDSIDVLVSSPLIRAVETAEIVAREYGAMKFSTAAALSPGRDLQAILETLRIHKSAETIALVGHEPSLSLFASWSLTGLHESFMELKKGGVCLLEFAAPPAAGHAKLRWLLAPSQLRHL